MTTEGVPHWFAYDGAINKARFISFVRDLLGPNAKDTVIVMDNIRFHHSKEVVELIERTGASILYTAPYHPEQNAIEEAFSFVKHHLRKLAPRCLPSLIHGLRDSFARLTPAHLAAYTEHVFKLAKMNQPG